ncbi:MAG: hypothetical protein AAGI54_07720 [Planctomycetota bacterium]
MKREKQDEQTLFMQGISIYETSHHLKEQAKQTASTKHMSIISIWLAPFACEMLLKCLSCIANGDFLKTHDFELLFADLPEETQKNLEGDYAQHAVYHWALVDNSRRVVTLQTLLDSTKDLFKNFRYLTYERAVENSVDVSLLNEFTFALIGECRRLRPEWFHENGRPCTPFHKADWPDTASPALSLRIPTLDELNSKEAQSKKGTSGDT